MRALVVTNMAPTPDRPARGTFVRDQVDALRRRGDVDVELFAFEPGAAEYPRAARDLRRRFRGRRFDVVHAHFGLSAWPALLARLGPVVLTLHGNDLFHPRSRRISLAALPFCALAATVSRELAMLVPRAGTGRRVAVLPVGIDLDRFSPMDRREARRALGRDPDRPFLLFPHDPARASKRHDRAEAAAAGAELVTLGDRPPTQVPLWVNAANAVLVPSEVEGFGLSAIEALACDVPVIATPVGIHPVAVGAVPGAACLPWDEGAWRAWAQGRLLEADPRATGRHRAGAFGSDRMADRVAAAWRWVRTRDGGDASR